MKENKLSKKIGYTKYEQKAILKLSGFDMETINTLTDDKIFKISEKLEFLYSEREKTEAWMFIIDNTHPNPLF